MIQSYASIPVRKILRITDVITDPLQFGLAHSQCGKCIEDVQDQQRRLQMGFELGSTH